jgi:hypothetical protein
MKHESDVKQSLIKALRGVGAIVQPIESGSTGDGIPDEFICTRNGKNAWMEVKYENIDHAPVPYTVKYRPGQFQWLTNYYAHKGLSILTIGTLIGTFFFYNKGIQKRYETDFTFVASLWLKKMDGQILSDWIDAL